MQIFNILSLKYSSTCSTTGTLQYSNAVLADKRYFTGIKMLCHGTKRSAADAIQNRI
jgi:hypothetical protein